MASVYSSKISCGVDQICDLNSNPINNIRELCVGLDFEHFESFGAWHNSDISTKCAFIIWSDRVGDNIQHPGEKLYFYIRDTFGRKGLTKSVKAVNPNTGNSIAVYIWKIKPRALFERYKMGNFEKKRHARRSKNASRRSRASVDSNEMPAMPW